MNFYSINNYFIDSLSNLLIEKILIEHFNTGDSIYFNSALTEIELCINKELNELDKNV